MMENYRTWYGVELDEDTAEVFRHYLRERGIRYEPSSAWNLIHFECYMTKDERKAANEFIQGVVSK